MSFRSAITFEYVKGGITREKVRYELRRPAQLSTYAAFDVPALAFNPILELVGTALKPVTFAVEFETLLFPCGSDLIPADALLGPTCPLPLLGT